MGVGQRLPVSGMRHGHRRATVPAVQRVLRFLLVWLLAAVMPLKGMAAVLLLACGPGQAAGMVQAPPSLAAHGPVVHGGHQHHPCADRALQPGDAQRGHAQRADAQHGDSQHGDQQHGNAADTDERGGSGHAHATAKCGTCAGLPMELPRLATLPAGAQCFEPMARCAVRFLTDGPDRPPRSTIG